MARLWFGIVIAVVVFTVFVVVDALLIDRSRVRALPRALWVVVILLIPVVGGILWLSIGRARRTPNRVLSVSAPDDDPSFLHGLRTSYSQDERLREIERELADLDSNGSDPVRGAEESAPADETSDETSGETDRPGRRDG